MNLIEAFYSQEILSSMAVSVAVLDERLRINWANEHMIIMLGVPIMEAKDKRPGDVIRCVNASCLDASGKLTGCGNHTKCASCLLQQYAKEALSGNMVRQKEVNVLAVTKSGEIQELSWLLSASPLNLDQQTYAVITLQDITLLHKLRGILPICMYCHKIRRDDTAWEILEEFVEKHSLAQFSHSICPTCIAEHYPDGLT